MNISPASIEELTTKFQGAENLTDAGFAAALQKEPRLRSLLLWLQWLELQPGGLEKFSADTIAQFTASCGPAFLHAADDPQLTSSEREEAFGSLSSDYKERLIPQSLWHDDGFRVAIPDFYSNPSLPHEKKLFAEQLRQLDPGRIREAFIDGAKERLPGVLRSLCDPEKTWRAPAPWWCKELLAVLFEAMDAHARAKELEIAHTKLVDIVFEKLDFAWHARKFIKIDGNSRIGKTKAAKAWCAMHPGRARLVNTPPGLAMRDVYAACAEAVGIPFSYKTPVHVLKEKVQFVTRYAGLFLVFDEAHRLLPPPSSTVATPARLEYIRANIIDLELPCAFLATPQAFKDAVNKFRGKTSWNFDQFFGRIALTVKLPPSLDDDDLLELAKVHGAGMPEQFQRRIRNEVIINKGYARAIEDVCDRARHLAKLAGRADVIEWDIEKALSEVIPNYNGPPHPAHTPAIAPRPLPSAPAPAAARNRVQQPGRPQETPAPAREIQPLITA